MRTLFQRRVVNSISRVPNPRNSVTTRSALRSLQTDARTFHYRCQHRQGIPYPLGVAWKVIELSIGDVRSTWFQRVATPFCLVSRGHGGLTAGFQREGAGLCRVESPGISKALIFSSKVLRGISKVIILFQKSLFQKGLQGVTQRGGVTGSTGRTGAELPPGSRDFDIYVYIYI